MAKVPWWALRPAFWWILGNPAAAAVLAYAAYYAPIPVARIIWAAGAEMGPALARTGVRVAAIALESGSAVRAAWFVSKYSGAVAVGAVVGAGAGIVISRVVWGEKGQQDVTDVYTGKVSASTWFHTIEQGLLSVTPGHRGHGHKLGMPSHRSAFYE